MATENHTVPALAIGAGLYPGTAVATVKSETLRRPTRPVPEGSSCVRARRGPCKRDAGRRRGPRSRVREARVGLLHAVSRRSRAQRIRGTVPRRSARRARMAPSHELRRPQANRSGRQLLRGPRDRARQRARTVLRGPRSSRCRPSTTPFPCGGTIRSASSTNTVQFTTADAFHWQPIPRLHARLTLARLSRGLTVLTERSTATRRIGRSVDGASLSECWPDGTSTPPSARAASSWVRSCRHRPRIRRCGRLGRFCARAAHRPLRPPRSRRTPDRDRPGRRLGRHVARKGSGRALVVSRQNVTLPMTLNHLVVVVAVVRTGRSSCLGARG